MSLNLVKIPILNPSFHICTVPRILLPKNNWFAFNYTMTDTNCHVKFNLVFRRLKLYNIDIETILYDFTFRKEYPYAY